MNEVYVVLRRDNFKGDGSTVFDSFSDVMAVFGKESEALKFADKNKAYVVLKRKMFGEPAI